MKQLFSRRISATLLVAGLLLSACGQSDASGRVRNSSLGEGCFATQEEKDKEVKYYQEFINLSTITKNEFDNIDKALQEVQLQLTDLYNKTTEALNELEAKPSAENEAKVVTANAEWKAKQTELSDLFPKFFEAKRNIREYPQFEAALKDVENKPVCESTPETIEQPAVAQEPAESPEPSEPSDNTSSVDNQITENTTKNNPNNTIINIPNNQISKTNIEECQQPLEVTGGINQVIRVGETLEFIFPLCSTDSYVTVWGDFETGLSVYSNEVVIENKPNVVIRLSSSQPLAGTYFFQQIDRISKTFSPKSQLDLTVIDPEETQLCAGKTPNVAMSANGDLTAESTCDETEYIGIQILNIETGSQVFDIVTPQTSEDNKMDNLFYIFGTELHEVTAYHVKWDKDAERRDGGRLGDVLTFRFQLEPNTMVNSLPFDSPSTIPLPPFFDLEPNAETTPTPDNINESTTAKILISPTTAAVSCGDACTTNVIQQSGVAPENVEKVEASVNGSEWVSFTSATALPLSGVTNTVAVRVTPKDGSEPVVLTNTLYRDAEALSGSDVAETIALSIGGEQTITVEPGRSGISPAQTILIAVAVIVLLLLAMLLMRARRKPQA